MQKYAQHAKNMFDIHKIYKNMHKMQKNMQTSNVQKNIAKNMQKICQICSLCRSFSNMQKLFNLCTGDFSDERNGEGTGASL